MPEPIAEQIVAVIKSRIVTYTSDTQRSTRVGTWQPKDGTIVVYQGSLTENPELSCQGNPPAKAWNMEVVIACLLKPSDTDTTPIDTYKNRIWAEIVKAVNTGTNWHSMGGLALDSNFGSVEDHTDGDGAFAGVKLSLNVLFRVDEDNPFNVRA